jgi:hypothetical protein
MATIIRHNGDGTHTESKVKNQRWLLTHAEAVHTIIITRNPSGGGAKMRALLVNCDYLTNWESFDLARSFVNRRVFDGVALYIVNNGATVAKPIDFYSQEYVMSGTDVVTHDPGGRSMVLRSNCKPATMPAS